MIITFLASSMLVLIGLVFSLGGLLPPVSVLPFGVDSFLTTGMGYAKFIFTVIPPLGIMYGGFMAIINFRFVMLLFRLFRLFRSK